MKKGLSILFIFILIFGIAIVFAHEGRKDYKNCFSGEYKDMFKTMKESGASWADMKESMEQTMEESGCPHKKFGHKFSGYKNHGDWTGSKDGCGRHSE